MYIYWLNKTKPQDIAKIVKRHRLTVRYGIKKISDLLEVDKNFQSEFKKIYEKVNEQNKSLLKRTILTYCNHNNINRQMRKHHIQFINSLQSLKH